MTMENYVLRQPVCPNVCCSPNKHDDTCRPTLSGGHQNIALNVLADHHQLAGYLLSVALDPRQNHAAASRRDTQAVGDVSEPRAPDRSTRLGERTRQRRDSAQRCTLTAPTATAINGLPASCSSVCSRPRSRRPYLLFGSCRRVCEQAGPSSWRYFPQIRSRGLKLFCRCWGPGTTLARWLPCTGTSSVLLTPLVLAGDWCCSKRSKGLPAAADSGHLPPGPAAVGVHCAGGGLPVSVCVHTDQTKAGGWAPDVRSQWGNSQL